MVDDFGIDCVFIDGLCDFQVEDEVCDYVECGCEYYGLLGFQYFG